MALTKFTNDLNIISALPDEPNDVGGLTAEQVKAKFDEGSKVVQTFINETLTKELDEQNAEIDAQKATKEEIQGIVLGQIPDGTITKEKLSPSFALPVNQGGTGATTPEAARSNLGVTPTIIGTTAPTNATVGVVGQFYLDTVTGIPYQCNAVNSGVYTWKPVVKVWKLLQAYTTAGSYTFTVPDGITEIGAFIIGAGGSGGAIISTYQGYFQAQGGASGHTKSVVKQVNTGESYSLVVGAGGVARTISGSTGQQDGNTGGTSSFNGINATGGEGGTATSDTNIRKAPNGGQGASISYYNIQLPAFGFISMSQSYTYSGGHYYQGDTTPIECIDPFSMKKLLIAGGLASYYYPSTYNSQVGNAIIDDYGNYGSSGASSSSATNTAIKGTSYGCGGGGAISSISYGTATSAAGCDGAVLVYGR